MNGKALVLDVCAASLLGLFSCILPGNSEVMRDDDPELLRPCQISAYLFRDERLPPKAIVVIVHGFTQNGRSPEALALRLAQAQYMVVSLDQRGHGRWHYKAAGPASDLQGKTKRACRLVDYKASIEDLKQLVRALKEAYPELPLYCIGESAGGVIVAESALSKSSGIDGIVLCSPGSRPRIYNLLWVIKDFVCNVYRLNHPVDLRRYIRKYASNDPRVVEEMIAEPLDRNELSGRELLRTVSFIHHIKSAVKRVPDHIPLLVIQGKQDHIVQPRTVLAIVRGASARDKSLVYFPKYGHVLIGTSYIQPGVSEAITTWLDARFRAGCLSASRNIAPAAK
ncbi:MAG TPA: alpha/beta fold hydrolase [Candidatus Obscuribacterales bacterium]